MGRITLPGLIDAHVHLREPGATHKEDWNSGTAAALAGGFTLVCAMPNTNPPITTGVALEQMQQAARAGARCDYGIYFGGGADNVDTAAQFADMTVGLKLYLDQTYGALRIEGLAPLVAHAARWPAAKPLLVHAEERTLAAALLVAQLAGRGIHICHVSRRAEIELVREAKQQGLRVTCEVAPHHLFLSEADAPNIGAGRSEVRPRLATPADVQALRENLEYVDCFATDHAPHLLTEKDGANPPPGFPGLETALPLYLELVHSGLLTLEGLEAKCITRPCEIFNLPPQPETWIEVDPDAEWTARGAQMQTRAKWTPFEARRLRGRVERVYLRGALAYENGNVLSQPGFGIDACESELTHACNG